MKVILSMAVSVNGFIATQEGSEDFLSHDNWTQFVKLAHKIGCLIWGRKTFDAVSKWEGDYLLDLKGIKTVIISHSPLKLPDGFTLANSPEDALKQLRIDGFEKVIVSGGSTINSEFAKKGLIDEVIFAINPAIIGAGIPVFAVQDFTMNLELVDIKKVGSEIVELRYKVKK